jgi:hypothetical protein
MPRGGANPPTVSKIRPFQARLLDFLRGTGLGGLWRHQGLPMLGKLRLRLGERLQLLERHAWYHLDHEQSLRRHIDHREVAVNAPHPVTNTVDPWRTPATASAVVSTSCRSRQKAPWRSIVVWPPGLTPGPNCAGIDHQARCGERYKFAWGNARYLLRGRPGVSESSRRLRLHNDFRDENRGCKVPPPCF